MASPTGPNIRTQSAPDFFASCLEAGTIRLLGMCKRNQPTPPAVEAAPAVDVPPVQADKLQNDNSSSVRNGEAELKENLYNPHAEALAQRLLEEVSSSDEPEELPGDVDADIEASSGLDESKEDSKVDDRQQTTARSDDFKSQVESEKNEASSSAKEAKKVLDSHKKRKHHHHHKHHHHKKHHHK